MLKNLIDEKEINVNDIIGWDRDKRLAVVATNGSDHIHQGYVCRVDKAGRLLRLGRNFLHRLHVCSMMGGISFKSHMQSANDRRSDYKRAKDDHKYFIITRDTNDMFGVHGKHRIKDAFRFAKMLSRRYPDVSVEVYDRDRMHGMVEFYKGETFMFFHNTGKPVMTKRQVKEYNIDWKW